MKNAIWKIYLDQNSNEALFDYHLISLKLLRNGKALSRAHVKLPTVPITQSHVRKEFPQLTAPPCADRNSRWHRIRRSHYKEQARALPEGLLSCNYRMANLRPGQRRVFLRASWVGRSRGCQYRMTALDES